MVIYQRFLGLLEKVCYSPKTGIRILCHLLVSHFMPFMPLSSSYIFAFLVDISGLLRFKYKLNFLFATHLNIQAHLKLWLCMLLLSIFLKGFIQFPKNTSTMYFELSSTIKVIFSILSHIFPLLMFFITRKSSICIYFRQIKDFYIEEEEKSPFLLVLCFKLL